MSPDSTAPGTRTRILPWFLIVVGAMIAGFWIVLVGAGNVAEIEAGDRDIWFHLAAESITAALLIMSGALTLRGERPGRHIAGIGLGALLYTTINSAGFYADRGEWEVVTMFMALAAATVVATAGWIRGGSGRTSSSSYGDSPPVGSKTEERLETAMWFALGLALRGVAMAMSVMTIAFVILDEGDASTYGIFLAIGLLAMAVGSIMDHRRTPV